MSRNAKNTISLCGECFFDYVQISYGSANGYGNETYCGSDLPEPITSSGNTMTVTFFSDISIQFTGFSATWEAVEGGSSGGGGIGGGSESTESPSGGDSDGEIESPNYPNFYPPLSNEVIIAYNYFRRQHKYHTSC